MGKNLIFFVDFDGTVVSQDICASMVKQYAGKGWEELNQLWEQGELSTGECAQQTLNLMQVKPEELHAFFGRFELDPGFKSFASWTATNNHPVYILSDGYDNYIDLVFRKYGLNIPYYANHLEFEDGWRFVARHQNGECDKCGVCKKQIIEEKTPLGWTRIYIGDGYSDTCPVSVCDMVFAKNSLADYCRSEGIAFEPYQDFNDITRKLDEVFLEGKNDELQDAARSSK
ncbi:MtnX-like HAD-IB family phosphatase [Syntrophomonas palmitatica]|uniref:MtnX-like HAD-IB family phosphatase n=1 Tax=Syntrophomonas palmitatica TaxID=402877 RepID=UPI0006CFD1C8|nr:MtnX-like HAD-IB family phosphatase [Syntrophomonas palmitatica]